MLTINGCTDSKSVLWKKDVQNGTLYLKGSANVRTAFKTSAAVTMTDVTLIEETGFNLANALSVRDYTARMPWDSTYCSGSAALNVYGTFKPVTDFFYGCTMQDGSTLDLSTRTGVWSTTTKATKYTAKTVQFAKGATVYVDLGARGDSGVKGKIVDWTGHAPDSTVTFKEAPSLRGKGMIRVENDGIYITRGLTIYIR